VIALLYLATAVVLLWLAHRTVIEISRGAALALLLLPLCFTGRAVLTGRVYAPVEMPYVTQPLSDHRAEMHVGPVHNPILADIAYHMLPWREALRRSLRAGEWPLLNRFILCGDNLAASGQPAVFSPFTLLACILPTAPSFTYTGVIGFFVAGVSAFLFARVLQRSVVASLVAAIGWMFSAPIALHILFPLGFAWTLLPFVLAATRLVVIAPGRRSVGILTTALALEILAGHPETVLHVTAVGAAYGIFELVRLRDRRSQAMIGAACAGVLALLLTAIYLLPLVDAVRRTGEYFVRASIYARIPLRVPNGFVTAAAVSDLFPFVRVQFGAFLLPRAEAGSILLALAIYALWRVRSSEVWFFAVVLVVALLAGTNAWPVAQFLHRLPLFNQTLNDRLSAVVPLCLALLAAFAIDAWSPRRVVAVMGTIFLTMAAASVVWTQRCPVDQARLMAELFPLALATLLALFIRRADLMSSLLIGMLLLQRTIADGSLVPVHPRSAAYPPLKLFQPLQQVREPFRLVGKGVILLPNTATMYGLEDPRGSAATTLAEFAETFPLWLTREPGRFDVRDLTRPILSMMNVRYALIDVSDPIPPEWRHVTVEKNTRLIENERALPRAFIPRYVRLGRSASQELEEMDREIDFSEHSWLYVSGPPHERANGPGTVSISSRRLGFDLDVTMENAGFVVISEAAWPAWRIHVDGRRVKSLRANHAFLAVYVPAGRHSVRLVFLSQSFVAGRAITFATALLLAIGAITSSPRFRRLPRFGSRA
jgi:hypothetical protein